LRKLNTSISSRGCALLAAYTRGAIDTPEDFPPTFLVTASFIIILAFIGIGSGSGEPNPVPRSMAHMYHLNMRRERQL
jgi:hypothetical protein